MCLLAGGTAVLVNLPFAVAGYDGWRAAFTFQQLRKVDLTTNSIWYWGYRPESEPANVEFQAWWTCSRRRWCCCRSRWLSAWAGGGGDAAPGTGGAYPWVGVSAAMLCGFLLLHKVHSPQYTLWLLPFFVLLAVPWGWVAAYLVADAVMGIGIFRWFYAYDNGLDTGIQAGFAAQAVAIGVWGRAVLLVVLFVLFLRLPELRTTPAEEPV